MHIAQKVRMLCGQSATREQVVTATKDVWDDAEIEMAAAANQLVQRDDANAEGCLVASNNRAALNSKRAEETRRCYGCGVIGHLRSACAAVCAKCGGWRHTELFVERWEMKQGSSSRRRRLPKLCLLDIVITSFVDWGSFCTLMVEQCARRLIEAGKMR